MLNAMSQGRSGSMCTIHADSSAGVFRRIASYAVQAPERLPLEASNLLIAGAVHFVVHLDSEAYDPEGQFDPPQDNHRLHDVRRSDELHGTRRSDELARHPPLRRAPRPPRRPRPSRERLLPGCPVASTIRLVHPGGGGRRRGPGHLQRGLPSRSRPEGRAVVAPPSGDGRGTASLRVRADRRRRLRVVGMTPAAMAASPWPSPSPPSPSESVARSPRLAGASAWPASAWPDWHGRGGVPGARTHPAPTRTGQARHPDGGRDGPSRAAATGFC